MGRVRVVTDTTHYLPRDIVEREGIELVSLYVNWNGATDRESEMGDFGDFYAHLGTSKDLPTTSQPSVGDFLATYEPIAEAGDDIVSIHLSGGISGTVGAAHQARQALIETGVDESRIAVYDSETACGGLGLVALAACAAAGRGGSCAEVVAAAQALRADLKTWFAVDTLEFLRRGGRIGAAQAYLGSALRIKPILTLGKEIEPVERVRTAGRAVARLKEFLAQRHDEGADRFAVQHIRDPERAEELVAAGRELYGTEPLFVSEVGPVIGTHVGPGLLGVTGVRSELLAAGA
ncbi:MAG: fatty acid kinase fatty acid binding subunit [Solirubrobacteraceae bacterium]|jgi:DegV family protein with EDD domain|nr:fatty acid kinase fatty acid binding subunit [Solirubrobacteraceae bacterium]